MATEVLLMADVVDLGGEGDVVTVADGYARNYLIPKKLGAPVSEATRRRLEKIRREREVTKKAEVAEAKAMAARLEGVSCTIPVKTGKDEKLYGSITAADIVEVLKAQGVELEPQALKLEEPIKELGVFDVEVGISADVKAAVKVWVVEE